MPTQPTDPKIRMLPNIDDASIREQHNRAGHRQNERTCFNLADEPAQPPRAHLRRASSAVHDGSDESLFTPGPSFGMPHNYQRSDWENESNGIKPSRIGRP